MNIHVILHKCSRYGCIKLSALRQSWDLGIIDNKCFKYSSYQPQIPPAIAHVSHHPCSELCLSAAASSSTFVPKNSNNFLLQHQQPGAAPVLLLPLPNFLAPIRPVTLPDLVTTPALGPDVFPSLPVLFN